MNEYFIVIQKALNETSFTIHIRLNIENNLHVITAVYVRRAVARHSGPLAFSK